MPNHCRDFYLGHSKNKVTKVGDADSAVTCLAGSGMGLGPVTQEEGGEFQGRCES
jgi:hypothetical protein